MMVDDKDDDNDGGVDANHRTNDDWMMAKLQPAGAATFANPLQH